MQLETIAEKLPPKRIKLADLFDEIRNLHSQATTTCMQANGLAESGLNLAVLCGAALKQAQSACKGHFLKALAENCPKISRSTAYNWMALHTKSNNNCLQHVGNIRQAYIELGIIKDTKPERKEIDLLNAPNLTIYEALTDNIHKRSKSFRSLLDTHAPEELPRCEAEKIRDELRPLMEYYARIELKLGGGVV